LDSLLTLEPFEYFQTSDSLDIPCKSNSNSLANQLGIYLILVKRENLASNSLANQLGKNRNLASNSLANQLGKNRNLAKLTSPRGYMRARIVVAIGVSL
jgi:hypothetical protein